MAGGDVNLGRGVGRKLLADLEYDPFRGVAPWFGAADLVFVNLESPIADLPGPTEHPTEPNVFAGPPVGAGVLPRSHVGIVSVANNHAWDYGRTGFLETLDSLRNAGVAYAGGTDVPGEPYRARVLVVRGFRVAVLAVTDVWNYARLESHPGKDFIAGTDFRRLEPEILRARRENDVVLLSYHGGREYDSEPTADTIAFARRAVKLGVDAVIGHHPHVPQGIGWVRGKPVFYSLGNLVFGVMRDYPATAWGVLAKLVFDGHGGLVVRACPYRIGAASLPQPATPVERAGRAIELTALSARVGGTKVGDADSAGCFLLEPASAR